MASDLLKTAAKIVPILYHAGMNTSLPPGAFSSEAQKNRRAGQIFLGLIGAALLVQGILRLWTAASLVSASDIAGQLGGFVHWRIFDQFGGWIALLLLAIPDAGRGPGRAIVRWVFAAGLVGLTVTLLMGDVGGRAVVELGVAILLALAALLVAGRQILVLAGTTPESNSALTIEQLWRGITTQWLLLWVAAEVTLRIRFRREGIEAEEFARSLLFLLPVLGVGVNVIMAMGLRWWSILKDPDATGSVRGRAWVVAMLAVNLGIVLVIIGALWARGLGVVGAAFLIAGVALYMIGFPARAWRGGGKLVPAAFGILVLALLLMTIELLVERRSMPELYSAGWRHLLASVDILWLAGMGGLALRNIVPPHIAAGARGAALASGWLLLSGTLATAGTFLLGISAHEFVRGLFVGAGLQLAGVIVGFAVALRAGRGLSHLSSARTRP